VSLTAGSRLGPYQIVSPLGAGGMGEVYRARDTRLERTVAIKILPPQLSNDPVRKQRFEREAKTISSLNHPHICVLYDVGHQEGIDYLVMECVEGETLAKRLEKGPLPLDQVVKFGGQMADALDRAHRSGVVHRDLKPGNIMLTSSGAKLLDFGLAKPAVPLTSGATLTAAATQTTPVTQEGTILGTFQYMSPEQIEGKELDGRSDIFSLGAVLYEMLTGQRAFQGKSQLSVASAILEKEPEPISALRPMTSPLLEHIIRKSLAKLADERWQSASDLASELKWIAEGSSRGVGVPRKGGNQREYRGLLTAGIVAMALLAGAGAAYFSRPALVRRLIRTSILPPEGFSFDESSISWGVPVISPDGTRIVVGVIGQTGRDILYVRPLDALTGQPLAGTEGAAYPFWSPDGRTIGFFADGQLRTIDASGGPVQIIAPAPDGRGGTWNRAGVIVYSPTSASSMYQVASGGGVTVAVTKIDGSRHEDSHRWPQFLPDGRHFFYLARTADVNSSEIRIGSIDSEEPASGVVEVGNPVYAAPGYLFYPRGNTLVARAFDEQHLRVTGEEIIIADQVRTNGNVQFAGFSVSANGMLIYLRNFSEGASELIWADRSGKILGKVGEPGRYFGPTLSPDGSKIAVEVSDAGSSANSDIWIYDAALGSKSRLTFSGTNERNHLPVWSPDGSRLVFSAERGGHSQIYEKAINGVGGEHLIVKSDGHQYATSWSLDGRFIAGIQERPEHGGTQFLVVPVTANQKPVPFLPGTKGLLKFTFPRISPNGKWIAYPSWETGRGEVYISSFPSGTGKWQVSTNGGVMPEWRRDGKELFYLSLNDTLMAAEISERAENPMVGKTQVLFRLHQVPSTNWAYSASPDGKRFLINSVLQPSVPWPITLVVNWDAELKKK